MEESAVTIMSGEEAFRNENASGAWPPRPRINLLSWLPGNQSDRPASAVVKSAHASDNRCTPPSRPARAASPRRRNHPEICSQ